MTWTAGTSTSQTWSPIDVQKFSREQRRAAAVKWRAGDLRWLLHPGQQKVYDWWRDHKFGTSLILVGRQWGKSTLALALALEQCFARPRSVVRYGFPTKSQGYETIEPKLFDLLQSCPEKPKKLLTGGWLFSNGSRLSLAGTDVGRGERLRGPHAHLVVLDECRDMRDLNYLIRSLVLPQFVTTKGRLLLISTPPNTPGHALTQDWLPLAQRMDPPILDPARWVNGPGAFWHSTWKDNPMLSEEWLRREVIPLYAGGERDPEFQLEYMANWKASNQRARVTPAYDDEANLTAVEGYHAPPLYLPVVSADLGFHDYSGVIAGHIDHRQHRLIITHEYYQPGATESEIAQAVRAIEHEAGFARVPVPVQRWCDAPPMVLAGLSRDHKVSVNPVRPSDRKHMISQLNDFILKGRILIHQRCETLRHQLVNGVWNSARNDYQRDQQGGHLDLVDALKYLVLMAPVNSEAPRARLWDEMGNDLPLERF